MEFVYLEILEINFLRNKCKLMDVGSSSAVRTKLNNYFGAKKKLGYDEFS